VWFLPSVVRRELAVVITAMMKRCVYGIGLSAALLALPTQSNAQDSVLVVPPLNSSAPITVESTGRAGGGATIYGDSKEPAPLPPAPEPDVVRELGDPDGMVSFDTRASKRTFEGSIDSILPLYLDQSTTDYTTLYFLNAKATLNSEERFNLSLGLGARVLLTQYDMILGANLFGDLTQSQNDNNYWQFGAGLEVLSKWVDARFNYYLPEYVKRKVDSERDRNEWETSTSTVVDSTATSAEAPTATGNTITQEATVSSTVDETVTKHRSTRYYDWYEATERGFDTELGFLVPGIDKFLETRIYGGFYNFDNKLGVDSSGYKARLEAHVLPGLIADIEYRDDDLGRTDDKWFYGVRAWFPFELNNLREGRSPFEATGAAWVPGSRRMADRLVESVQRNPGVHTVMRRMEDKDRYEEDKITGTTNRRKTNQISTATIVLRDDIVFVDNIDRGGAGGDGTYENPFLTIDAAVDSPILRVGDGVQDVFVQAANPYNENVTIGRSAVITGSGVGIQGLGGQTFHGTGDTNSNPVVNGGFSGADLAEVRIKGFTINGGLTTGAGVGRGISLENVSFAEISRNTFNIPLADAISLSYANTVPDYGRRSYAAVIESNIVNTSVQSAVDVAVSTRADVTLLVQSNRFLNTLATPVNLSVDDNGSLDATIVANAITNTSAGAGITAVASEDGDISLEVNANTITGTAGAGISFASSSSQNVDASFSENIIRNAGAAGILVDATSASTAQVVVAVSQNTISNTTDGIRIQSSSTADVIASIVNNAIVSARQDGIDVEAGGTSHINATLSGNNVSRSTNNAVRLVSTTSARLDAVVLNNTLSTYTDGVLIDAGSDSALFATIQGNTLGGGNIANGDGVDIEVGSSAIAAITVANNTITNHAGNAIEADVRVNGALAALNITGNLMSSNGAQSVLVNALNSGLGNVTISGNIISNGSQVGVDLTGQSPGRLVVSSVADNLITGTNIKVRVTGNTNVTGSILVNSTNVVLPTIFP
jgi:hypothetical protein